MMNLIEKMNNVIFEIVDKIFGRAFEKIENLILK
jgi:hypothetical protein